MKKTSNLFVTILFLVLIVGSPAIAQETIKVPLSNPDEPGRLEVHLIKGSISVSGYDGENVEVTVEEQMAGSKTYKGRKMKKLSGAKGGFQIEEERNVVSISVEPWTEMKEISIKVPNSFSLDLQAINDGDIFVENVFGELEINNINGGVTLKNIIGPVVAHALNHDVIAEFKEIPEDEDMSLTSLNGDIEISVPEDSEFSLNLKTDNGDILSDFEIDMSYSSGPTASETKSKKGKYKITGDNKILGKVNGGGGEITMHTMNGDVVILKK